jgi:hypothetical protein
VVGETNVFAQFRAATHSASTELSATHWSALRSLCAALEADTRQLRATHLQGLAGTSYGSLARALLAPQRDARVLVIGTGALGRSILPLFSRFELGVWNHRHSAPLATPCHWFAPTDATGAAAWATDLILTTPADAAHDAFWRAELAKSPVRGLVHLGHRSVAPDAFAAGAVHGLDSVFALAAHRLQRRGTQLAAARAAAAALVAARFFTPALSVQA